jgi:mannose-1-phosphate guanylyltransferase / mannose-6-phosphate isomerase
MLRSENAGQQVVGLGLKNIIAIAQHGSVLIADKAQAQNVKNVVDFLKQKSISQAETFPKDYRPWGWFESFILSDNFQVKRIFVKPGGSLSLQSHQYRSEHWIVAEGSAKVTIDGDVKFVDAGQSVYVPVGAVHRMENLGVKPMVLIELQIGTYFGKDDIVRYEDVYARGNK